MRDTATSSLYRDLVLDTPEAARNMELAFERAERGEVDIPYEDVELCTDRDRIRRFLEGRLCRDSTWFRSRIYWIQEMMLRSNSSHA